MGCGGSKELNLNDIHRIREEYGLNLIPRNKEIFKKNEKSMELTIGETYSYYDIDSYDIFDCERTSTIPLLLLHDYSYSKEIFKTLIEALIKLGFRCIVPDLRGHGKTTYKSEIENINDFVTDIKNLADSIGVGKFQGIIGWGLGGIIGLRLAIDDSKFLNKLVLLNSIPVQGLGISGITKKAQCWNNKEIRKIKEVIYRNDIKIYQEFIYERDFNKKGKPIGDQLSDCLKSLMNFRCPVDAFWALLNFNISEEENSIVGTNEISKINNPVLVLHGKEDNRVDIKYKHQEIEYFEKNKLNFEYEFYENSGHYVLCDNYYDVIDRLKIFLKC